MTPRLRMLAGPNGSGKSTLAAQLSSDYAINLYRFLNADLLFAEVVQSHRTACPFSIDNAELVEFVAQSTYPENINDPLNRGRFTLTKKITCTFLRTASTPIPWRSLPTSSKSNT